MTEKSPCCAEVSRFIDASPERVFDAWLDPEKAGGFLFFSPGSEFVRIEIDARVGGCYAFIVQREGQTLTHTGEYLEIDRPRRLAFSFAVLELSPNYDRVTIDFVPEGTGCRVHLANEMAPEDWEQWGKQTEEGWTAILTTLASTLENGPNTNHRITAMNDSRAEATAADTIVIERLLPGPIERLWGYITEPDLRAQWLAGGATEVQEGGRIELRFNHADLSSEKEPPAAYVDYNCEIVFEGKVLRCEAPHHFAFTWGDGSQVAFELSEAGDDMVRLTITHTRLPGKGAMISVSSGWHAHLAILEDQLNGVEPRPFWSTMLALENTYRERLQ